MTIGIPIGREHRRRVTLAPGRTLQYPRAMTPRILAWLLPVIVPSALVAAGACAVQERDFGAGGAGAGSSDGGSGGFGGGGFGGDGTTGSFSTSSGPGFCDGTGICGVFSGNGCAQCATAPGALCSGAYQVCMTDINSSCEKYLVCVSNCGNTPDPFGCIAACGNAEPEGEALYQDLVTCVYCDVCPGDCKFETQNDPAFQGCF